uniref:Uncharacterized protein n=1 Tax=Anguilla anguilla TaxID=7936 RepID=A0A0E9TQC1_ANGAN
MHLVIDKPMGTQPVFVQNQIRLYSTNVCP